jgi:hypothetical protein
MYWRRLQAACSKKIQHLVLTVSNEYNILWFSFGVSQGGHGKSEPGTEVKKPGGGAAEMAVSLAVY